MFRPQQFKLYDPQNPEYEIAQSIIDETMRYVSPQILWWRYDHIETSKQASSIDKLYGENSKGEKFLKPIEIFGYVELNPILQELTRLGLEETEEINLFTDSADIVDRLGREPQGGDILRISYIQSDKKERNIFYKVSSYNPRHPFQWRYMQYQINCEKTDMSNIPSIVKNYFNLS